MSKINESALTSSPCWPSLEAFVRAQVQACVKQVLEEEVDQRLGRAKSVRRIASCRSFSAGHRKSRRCCPNCIYMAWRVAISNSRCAACIGDAAPQSYFLGCFPWMALVPKARSPETIAGSGAPNLSVILRPKA